MAAVTRRELDQAAERIAEEIMRQAGSGVCFAQGGVYVAKVRTEDNYQTFDCDAIAKVALQRPTT